MELTLSGCSITHIPKDGKKKKHELKIVHQGADALVLAVQSKEQAEEWLKVKNVVQRSFQMTHLFNSSLFLFCFKWRKTPLADMLINSFLVLKGFSSLGEKNPMVKDYGKDYLLAVMLVSLEL